MKTFADYLTESKKTYKFKLRVAGELPENFADKLDQAMTKFEVVSISTGKKTPITEKPLDFPQLANCEVTHYDVEVSYPVTAYVLEHYLVNETGTAHANLIVRGEGDPVEAQQMEVADDKAQSLFDNCLSKRSSCLFTSIENLSIGYSNFSGAYA
mgnify:CR=1 FL=1